MQPAQQDKMFNAQADHCLTPDGEPRGYIQPGVLKELWFHTGTTCNLSCPFCLEGSKPGDDRLNRVSFEDVWSFIDEAIDLGVERFSFTGGEPFVIKDFLKILDYALEFRPCLVLTNATRPLAIRFNEILPLRQKPNPLHFRVSLDYPDPAQHDVNRGEGNFELSLSLLGRLHGVGFSVSIARQRYPDENTEEVDRAFRPFLARAGLPADIRIVNFPGFLTPGTKAKVPQITEGCMTKYHTEESRAKFMCHFSKMVIKRGGRMAVSACTLVDDDEGYDLAPTLKESMAARIYLKHHRCYSCFARGASCSGM